MKSLPGKEVIEGLASLKRQIEEGKISPPVEIMLEKDGEKIVISFENLADIDIFGSAESKTAKISFLVKPEDNWTIKVSKDGNGDPVFLKNLD